LPVELPDVTLVAIDSVAQNLTQLAIELTLAEIEPAAVRIWGDRPILFGGIETTWFKAAPQSMGEVASILWYDAPAAVETSHMLVIQYDGWVLDGAAWQPEWLELDYLGAPWWYIDGLNVGNGGFSLRSTRLMQFLADHPERFPAKHPEDSTLCREYRRSLEAEGFIWGSQAQARDFSFERMTPRPTFGFHGIFNIGHVLSGARLSGWLAAANQYVREKPEWRELTTSLQRDPRRLAANEDHPRDNLQGPA
jgi:hypothetical protein